MQNAVGYEKTHQRTEESGSGGKRANSGSDRVRHCRISGRCRRGAPSGWHSVPVQSVVGQMVQPHKISCKQGVQDRPQGILIKRQQLLKPEGRRRR